VNEAETRRKLEEGGIDVEISESPAAFAAFYSADQARWAPVVRRAGVRVE
jgi:tripartite-type tricarboxylate transporter receptor subunit TctC